MTQDELNAAERWRAWEQIARPVQLPPADRDWKYWDLTAIGRRGFGKTRAAAEYISSLSDYSDLRAVLVTSELSMANYCLDMLYDVCRGRLAIFTSKRLVVFPRGGELRFGTTRGLQSISAMNARIIWADEINESRDMELVSVLARVRQSILIRS